MTLPQEMYGEIHSFLDEFTLIKYSMTCKTFVPYLTSKVVTTNINDTVKYVEEDKVLSLLKVLKSDVNFRKHNNKLITGAFHLACSMNRLNIVKLILSIGSFNQYHWRGGLTTAYHNRHTATIKFMIDIGKFSQHDWDVALLYSCSENCIDIVRLLLERVSFPDATLTHAMNFTCMQNNMDVAPLLLKKASSDDDLERELRSIFLSGPPQPEDPTYGHSYHAHWDYLYNEFGTERM